MNRPPGNAARDLLLWAGAAVLLLYYLTLLSKVVPAGTMPPSYTAYPKPSLASARPGTCASYGAVNPRAPTCSPSMKR